MIDSIYVPWNKFALETFSYVRRLEGDDPTWADYMRERERSEDV